MAVPTYLLGTLGQREVDVREHCHGQATEIELASTPATVALTLLTLGFYTPHELRLSCGPAHPAPALLLPRTRQGG